MKKYKHGGDCYRNQIDYDFSISVNPLGIPKAGYTAVCKSIMYLDRYPDDEGEELCLALAGKEGILPENIILGNGAAELIYALCHYLRLGKALAPAPCFGEYGRAVQAAGGEMIYAFLKEEKDFCLDEDFLSAIGKETELVFLCNPGNPDGRLIPGWLLEKTVAKCEQEGIWLCLDECFLPFLSKERELTMLGKLQEYPHLIVLRAFTKIYGVPGLRLGYACSGNKKLLEGMKASMQPWNTSIPAQMAGLAILKSDDAYLEKTKEILEKEREYLTKELSGGLAEKVYPSEANFILFKSRKELQKLLLKEKILIRDCSNFESLTEGYFRIGIRTHEENQELVRRWKGVVEWQNP